METKEMLALALDNKPIEFAQAFNDSMKERIASLVNDRREDMRGSVFNNPPESEEE